MSPACPGSQQCHPLRVPCTSRIPTGLPPTCPLHANRTIPYVSPARPVIPTGPSPLCPLHVQDPNRTIPYVSPACPGSQQDHPLRVPCTSRIPIGGGPVGTLDVQVVLLPVGILDIHRGWSCWDPGHAGDTTTCPLALNAITRMPSCY